MFPIKDHNPSGRVPIINYILISINILVFGYMFILPENQLMEFIDKYAVIPALVVQGKSLIGLLTSMFIHGSLGHIFGNMLFLNIFGDNLEDKLGHLGYVGFYLICGLGASVLQIIVNPGSTIPNLGASGAIAGVMGGYLVLFPKHKIDILFSFGFMFRKASVPAYFMLFYWFVAQLFSGVGSLAYMSQAIGGVAYFAHIGGFLVGWILISFLKSRLKKDVIYY